MSSLECCRQDVTVPRDVENVPVRGIRRDVGQGGTSLDEVLVEEVPGGDFPSLVLNSLHRQAQALQGLEASQSRIELNLRSVQTDVRQALYKLTGNGDRGDESHQGVDSHSWKLELEDVVPTLQPGQDPRPSPESEDASMDRVTSNVNSVTNSGKLAESIASGTTSVARKNISHGHQMTTTDVILSEALKTKKAFFVLKKNWTCPVCDELNKLDSLSCGFCDHPRPQPTFMQRIVQNPLFDVICGLVIVANAVSIAVFSHQHLTWALDNPGGKNVPRTAWELELSWFFMIFYVVELGLRLFAQGHKYFTGDEWHWNAFDVLLVVTVIYEKVIAEWVTSFVSVNVSWLRILRLLKMMKIFRVVRLMRFFRVLRLMVSQITGSFMMLVWAALLVFLMIFLFALCFVHGLTEFLLDTPRAEITHQAWRGINNYWSSLGHSMISLYMALAGGTDWYDIAAPIKVASHVYYAIFLFYIGFSFISVLNVVTSLYVESALKISDQDESTVQMAQAEREEVTTLMQVYKDKDEHGSGMVSWVNFKSSLKTTEMKRFMDSLGISLVEIKRVFKMLQHQGSVDIEEFIGACMKVVGDTRSIDLLQIHSEARRSAKQSEDMFDYFEDRFKTLLFACRQTGAEGIEFSTVQNHRLRMDLLDNAMHERQEQVALKGSHSKGNGKGPSAPHRAFRVARACRAF